MIHKKYSLSILFSGMLLLILAGCQNINIKEFPVTEVTRDTFVDQIRVTGVLETPNSYSIICPDINADATIIYLIPDGSYVKAGDTVCILESRVIENNYLDALRNLETNKMEYNKSQADLELQYLMLQAQVKTIDNTTKIAMLDSVQMNFASPLRKRLMDLELQKSVIQKEKILKQLEFLKTINNSELQKMKLRIQQQETRVETAKSKLDKLTITSEKDGLALRDNTRSRDELTKEGDIVWDMMPLVKIPDLSVMQVNLTVSESHFKRINKEQPVSITIDAIPGIEMKGKIMTKEPMGKPIARNSRVKTFGVTTSIDSLIGDLKPGISATCNIILKQINDTLMVPFSSIFNKDSINVAYVLKENSFEERPVTLAMHNNKIAIVATGLKQNEMVSLIKPPERLIKN